MIDKLDLEIPYGLPMKRGFARSWYDGRWDERLQKKHDALYAVTADLRPIGIPARLSIDHKHHKRLGPKLEIIGAGELGYSDWVAIARLVFDGDVEDAAIMRADLTADVEGITVGEFSGALWAKHKMITRTEYGQALSAEIQRRGAQTKYYGKKPNQIRIYDKTLHRKLELLPEHNRRRAQQSLEKESFETVFKYHPSKIITRVERQMGAREPETRWGVRQLGNVYQLADHDPFEQLQFRSDLKKTMRISDPALVGYIKLLREKNEREGLEATRAFIWQLYEKSESARKWWQRYASLVVESSAVITREAITAKYRESLKKQLAA